MSEFEFNAGAFAQDWAEAWNDSDVDAVLAHFHEDAMFTSPLAANVVPGSGGIIQGKAALREYWAVALAQIGGVAFEVSDVCTGLDSVAISYRNRGGATRIEVLRFRDGLVFEGHGTYA